MYALCKHRPKVLCITLQQMLPTVAYMHSCFCRKFAAVACTMLCTPTCPKRVARTSLQLLAKQ
jgi:hypothetical protein